jgi:hypothetical protein
MGGMVHHDSFAALLDSPTGRLLPVCCRWTSRAPLPTGEGESKEPESGLREWTAEPTLWDR